MWLLDPQKVIVLISWSQWPGGGDETHGLRAWAAGQSSAETKDSVVKNENHLWDKGTEKYRTIQWKGQTCLLQSTRYLCMQGEFSGSCKNLDGGRVGLTCLSSIHQFIPVLCGDLQGLTVGEHSHRALPFLTGSSGKTQQGWVAGWGWVTNLDPEPLGSQGKKGNGLNCANFNFYWKEAYTFVRKTIFS